MTSKRAAMINHFGDARFPWAPLLAAGLIVASILGLAGGGAALTLEEAKSRAASASPRLLAARAEADAALAEARAASWSRWPRLEIQLDAIRTDHPVHVFGGLLAQERFASENLGTFDPVSGFDLSTLNHPDPLTNVRGAVRVRQPLWTGGAVTAEVHAGRFRAERTLAAADRTSETLVFETEAAFRGALLAEERLDLLRSSLAVARAQAARVESLHAVGLALQSDRRSLEAHVHEAEAALSAARADSVDARGLLGVLLGEAIPAGERLVAPLEGPARESPTLAEALVSGASRSDVREARAGVREAEAAGGLARSGLFPAFEVFASAEHNGERPFGEGGDQWMVGFGGRWGFDGGIPQRIRAAGARARAAREKDAAVRARQRHEVVSAYGRLEAVETRTTALEAAVTAAEAAFTLIETRHREGLATALELTEAQNALTRTRLEAAAARRDAALARAALRLAAGTDTPSEVSP